jgi:hypothetical protein
MNRPTPEAIRKAMDVIRNDIMSPRSYGENERLKLALRLADIDPANISMSYDAMAKAYDIMHESTKCR